MEQITPKAKILVVDDALPNLRLLTSMLVVNGYEVWSALDGISALVMLEEKIPDLILLDILLPGIDGFEVCQRLKANEKTRHIPVIFVSALDEQADKVQGFAVGGVDYITKPYQVREVIARVETHLALRNLQKQLEIQNLQLQQEIAERKRAEEALYQANQVRDIVNTVPEGVLLLNEEGKILLANTVAEGDLSLLAGVAPGDLLTHLGDQPLAELLKPPVSGLWHEVTCGPLAYEVVARPMISDDKPTSWVMVLHNVSQEREIERRIRQQERLAAVGQLAAGIAHDFNNIMAVILLYTEMALGSPDLPARLREGLITVAQQARRASDLTQQILDFSRRTVLERRPMDLLPFLKEQVKLLERTLPEHIRLRLNYAAGEYFVNADPTRMQQAIMNLAVNARDAMLEGGDMNITLSNTSPQENDRCSVCGHPLHGNWVKLTISDTGCGISPSALPHIFEPFFTTKGPGQGTGLGLAQVYGIIRQHEGHVNVRSVEGKGTTFSIFLPALPSNPPQVFDLEPPSLKMGAGQTVLLVEDEPATREALVAGLALLNYHVIPTLNGREALALLQRDPSSIDLLISDVVMPEMGGIALFHEVLAMGLNLPIILISGHPIQEELEKLKGMGLSAWLPKPPTLQQLALVIDKVLKEKSA